MENTRETENTRKPIFTRKARIGLSVLELVKLESTYVKVNAFGHFTTKTGKVIPKWDVTNLLTGEEQTMWLDGGIKGQLSTMGGYEGVVGKSLEIKKTGQTQIENEEGEMVNVNQYDIFELA